MAKLIFRKRDVVGGIGVTERTLERGIRSGRYPAPDGYDGRSPFWFPRTWEKYFEALAKPQDVT